MWSRCLREFERLPRAQCPSVVLSRLQALDEATQEPALDWSRRHAISTTSWVGTMHVPGGCLDILPKTGFGDLGPDVVQRRLLRLLAGAGALPIEDRDWGGITAQPMPLWDGIAIAVARRLSRAILAGIPRAYHRVDDDAPVIRGRLRVEVLVRQTPPRLERPPISFDELSTDTPLTRILRDLARRLHQTVRSTDAARITREPWLLLEPLAGDWRPADQVGNLGRNDSRFKSLVAFHHLLVASRGAGLGSGDDQAFSLVFPMERVFEGYIANLLRRYARTALLTSPWVQGGPHSAYLMRDAAGDGIGRLKPDLALVDAAGRPTLIIDTKWKDLAGRAPSSGDLYQIHAYAAHWHCAETLLLLPAQTNGAMRSYKVHHDPSKRVRIGFIRIHHDESTALADLAAIIEDVQNSPTSNLQLLGA